VLRLRPASKKCCRAGQGRPRDPHPEHGRRELLGRENARFNKDISLAQVDEFLALMKTWGDAFPGLHAYRAGNPVVEIGSSCSRLDDARDVRLNLTRGAARLPRPGYWLYSILLLEPATPIFRLAKQEARVLADRFPDRGQVYGLFKNEGEMAGVRAWRSDKKSRLLRHARARLRADREARAARFPGRQGLCSGAEPVPQANEKIAVTPLAIALDLLNCSKGARAVRREALLGEAIRRAQARLAPASLPHPRRPPRPTAG